MRYNSNLKHYGFFSCISTSIAGLVVILLILVACNRDTIRQAELHVEEGSLPSNLKTEASADSARGDSAAQNRETGELCLMRGKLALTSSKTFVQAISEFHCVLMFSPELANEAHRGLGAVYANLGDLSKAIHHYKAYLMLAPDLQDRQEIEYEISRLRKLRATMDALKPDQANLNGREVKK